MTTDNASSEGPAGPLRAVALAEDDPAASLPQLAVLVVAPQPFYEDRGTPIAVRQLIEALSHLGYPVDVVTYPLGRSLALRDVRLFRSANPFQIRHVPIGFSARKVALDTALVPVLLRRLRRRRYAVIHAVEEAAFAAAILGPRHGIPVVYDMQSSLPEQLERHPILGAPLAQLLLLRAERWLLRRVDVVVGSAGLGRHVARVAPEAWFKEWHFAGVPPQVSPDEIAELRRSLAIEDGGQVVVYSGTFASYQGLPELVAAMPAVLREFPRAVFVLLGAQGAEGARIARLTGELARGGHVRVVERQRRELVPTYLAMADVLVSTRAHGGNLPLKVFDYLAAGRPIVATDVPAHRAALDPSRAVLVEHSARALAGAITDLLRDPARAAALAAEARRYAEVKLGWIVFLRSVAELYEQVTAPASHRRST